jgi:hypothetical protein
LPELELHGGSFLQAVLSLWLYFGAAEGDVVPVGGVVKRADADAA